MDENEGYRYDVFVSHEWGKKDRTTGKYPGHEKAMKFIPELESRGLLVWINEGNMDDIYYEHNLEHMENSACVLMLITRNFLETATNEEKYLCKELKYAQESKKKILPVLTDPNCTVEEVMNLFEGSRQPYDLSSDPKSEGYRKEFERLMEKLKVIAGEDNKLKDLSDRIVTAVQDGSMIHHNRLRLVLTGVPGAGKTSCRKSIMAAMQGDDSGSPEMSKLKDINVIKKTYSSHALGNFEDWKVTMLELGGERIVRALPQLFLSNYAINIVVIRAINIIVKWEETMSQLLFWLEANSATHCPIAIVATRWSQIIDQPEKEKQINDRMRSFIHNKKFENKIILNKGAGGIVFPFENVDEEMNKMLIADLKRELEATIQGQNSDRRWNQEIPWYWALFANFLIRKYKNYIYMDDLLREARRFNIKRRDVDEFVKFYSDVGIMMTFYRGHELIGPVILNRIYLIKVLDAIIYDSASLGKHVGFRPALRRNIIMYQKTGEINALVLEILISARCNGQFDPRSLDVALMLCKELNLITELPGSTSEEKRQYYVPAMDMRESPGSLLTDDDESFTFYMIFEKGLSQLIYQRFVSMFLTKIYQFDGAEITNLSSNGVSAEIRNFPVFVSRVAGKDEIEVAIKIIKEAQSHAIFQTVVKFAEEILEAMKLEESLNFNDCVLVVENESSLRGLWEDVKLEKPQIRIFGGKSTVKRKAFKDYFPSKVVAPVHEPVAIVPSKVQPSVGEHSFLYDVFLSHDWGENNRNHERAMKLAAELKQAGFKVWIDEDNLTTDIAKDIVSGIDQSACAILMITSNYLNRSAKDTNVAKEVAYVSRHGKALIPVVMESTVLDQSTWRGTPVSYHAGSLKYHNLCETASGEARAKEFESLCLRIRQDLLKLTV